jgi:hypothetical protein
MKIRDRGTKKWVSLMLPEHVRELKNSLIDETTIKQPILDVQKIEVMEETVLEAMKYNETLIFSIFFDGFIKTIIGKVHFIDYIQKEFRLKDEYGSIHFISFKDIVNIEKGENL